MLEQLAREHGFSFASMQVRFQKSRWGSCSSKGRISLNVCLIFLPELLVRYILLHELCHTRQMNHSAAFWKLVLTADPDALSKNRAMREAWKYVPGWAYFRQP
jgi:predicted metal-dependent hydrolase